MDNLKASMAQQIARAAKTFQQERTGHAPSSVRVVLSDDMLVITLHGALSKAEEALAKDPHGAAKVQEFHRQLLATTADPLRREIERITGIQVREATAEIEPTAGTVVKVVAAGTVVQLFLLAGSLAPDIYNSDKAAGQA